MKKFFLTAIPVAILAAGSTIFALWFFYDLDFVRAEEGVYIANDTADALYNDNDNEASAAVQDDRTAVSLQDNPNIIMVTVPFFIPPLDLRGYELNQYEMQEWFLERINYHRAAEGIHGYVFYTPAIVTSIEHSLDMRDNEFSSNTASDGRGHQVRHHRWMGYTRTRVTSAHSSSHTVSDGPLTQGCVNAIVDRVFTREESADFLLNPTYYYIGVGFSIQANGRGRLSITMATPEGERAAHRARSTAARAEHREAYLQMVRERTGWTAP